MTDIPRHSLPSRIDSLEDTRDIRGKKTFAKVNDIYSVQYAKDQGCRLDIRVITVPGLLKRGFDAELENHLRSTFSSLQFWEQTITWCLPRRTVAYRSFHLLSLFAFGSKKGREKGNFSKFSLLVIFTDDTGPHPQLFLDALT